MDKCYRKGHINDACVPNDYGMGRQETEKVVEYQDFKIYRADTYILQPIDIIPVVIGATGLMKTSLQKYLLFIPGIARIPN